MRLGLITILLLLATASIAPATTHLITPDGLGDYPTIQDAIGAASEGDTVVVANGYYTGDGNRDIDFYGKSLVLCSENNDPTNCIINVAASALDQHRGFIFQSGEDTTTVVSGFTITNGYADSGAAILCLEDGGVKNTIRSKYGYTNPRVKNCIVTNNTGTAIVVSGHASLAIYGCEVVYNIGDGCASESLGCIAWIRDSMFSYNTGTGMRINCNGGGPVYVVDCEAKGNGGAGAYVGNDTPSYFIRCNMSDNSEHGLSRFDIWSSVYVEGGRYCNNEGAGIYSDAYWAYGCYVDGAVIEGNGGAGIWTYGQRLNVTHSVIAGNSIGIQISEGDSTGGIQGPSQIELSTIASNDSAGIIYDGIGGLFLDKTIIANNLGQSLEVLGIMIPEISCSNIYDNSGGDWVDSFAQQLLIPGNIAQPPLFCNSAALDYSLVATSPCLEINNTYCGGMGALGMGCSPDIFDIATVKSYNSQSGHPNSQYVNEVVSVEGTVFVQAGTFSEGGYYLQDETGGINFYHHNPTVTPVVGDHIQVTGPLWYDSNFELYIGWPGIRVIDSGPEPEPTLYSTANLLSDYEHIGDFVSVFGNVASVGSAPFVIEQGGVPLEIRIDEDTGVDLSDVSIGDIYKVTGPCLINEGTICLSPRFQGDLEYLDGSTPTGVNEDIPEVFALLGCTPNPFNPMTTISYELPQPSHVNLHIYDIAGRLVRNLESGRTMEAGRHDVVWRGRDEDGRPVSTGVYMYRLTAGGYSETRRMVLVK